MGNLVTLGVDAVSGTSLNAASVAALIGLLIPVGVSLLSKLNAPDWVKIVLNLALTAIGGALATLVTSDGNYNVNGFIAAWLTAFVTSIASYYGVYKHGAAQAIQNATPNFGFGQGPVDTGDVQDDGQDVPVDVPDEAPQDGGGN